MGFLQNIKRYKQERNDNKFFHAIKKPIFIKDFYKESQELLDLLDLQKYTNDLNKKDLLEKDIITLKEQLSCDNSLFFQLSSSHISALGIYDIAINYNDETKPFDFLIIGDKYICVIDNHSLKGNITIDEDGKFYNIMDDGQKVQITPNPILENKIKINFLKELLKAEMDFNYIPFFNLVVNSDENGSIDKTNCPLEVREIILNSDKVIPFLTDKKSLEYNLSDDDMYKIGNYFLTISKADKCDYFKKYEISIDQYLKNKENLI